MQNIIDKICQYIFNIFKNYKFKIYYFKILNIILFAKQLLKIVSLLILNLVIDIAICLLLFLLLKRLGFKIVKLDISNFITLFSVLVPVIFIPIYNKMKKFLNRKSELYKTLDNINCFQILSSEIINKELLKQINENSIVVCLDNTKGIFIEDIYLYISLFANYMNNITYSTNINKEKYYLIMSPENIDGYNEFISKFEIGMIIKIKNKYYIKMTNGQIKKISEKWFYRIFRYSNNAAFPFPRTKLYK